LAPSTLRGIHQARWTTREWENLLSIHAGQGDWIAEMGVPAMLGNYQIGKDSVRFEPRFPLEAGVHYRAVFQPGRLPDARGAKPAPILSEFRRPSPAATPVTVVTQVYPSGALLPENLLKFYLHFSAPMRRGHIYDHIHLLDEAGRETELPFLEIDEELWNPAMTRLTLFIDPGRIKRGVKPLEEIGPALEEGKRFTLVIDQATLVDGATVLEDHERQWQFVPVDPWSPGRHRLLVQTTIEDLAGNNIGKLFEVDLFDSVQPRLTNSTVALPFEVR